MRGPNWGVVGALAFGVVKATDTAKQVFDRTTGMVPRPYLTSLVATGLAAGAAVAYADTPRERVLLAAAVAGTAAVLHEAQTVLETASERNRVMVVDRGARSAVSSMLGSAPGRRVRAI